MDVACKSMITTYPRTSASVSCSRLYFQEVNHRLGFIAVCVFICMPFCSAGAWGVLRIVLGYVLWFLICMELLVHSCVSFGRLAVTFLSQPVIGKESYQQSWQRFKVLCSSSTISSWKLLKTIPKYSPQYIQLKDKKRTKQLRDNSFFFRLFYFILL